MWCTGSASSNSRAAARSAAAVVIPSVASAITAIAIKQRDFRYMAFLLKDRAAMEVPAMIIPRAALPIPPGGAACRDRRYGQAPDLQNRFRPALPMPA